MANDVNALVISGEVYTTPQMQLLKSNQNCLKFDFKNIESYKLKDETPAQRENIFSVELLGRNAIDMQRRLTIGAKYQIHGYLRHDVINGKDYVRIRVFHMKEI